MADIAIHSATANERPGISALTVAAYCEYASIIPQHWEGYRQNILATVAQASPDWLLVAEMDGLAVGSVILYPAGIEIPLAGDAPVRLAEPELRLLAVAPPARGKGVGDALMQECFRRSRAAGASSITLHTLDFMQAAMRLYARLGFQPAPELDLEPAPGAIARGYRLRF